MCLRHIHAPRAWFWLHSHVPRAGAMLPENPKCAGFKRLFLLFVEKARVFSPNLVRNSYYTYQSSSFEISHSELEQFKRKAILELQRSFYLLLDFLVYVFIFSNLFLVTTCN